MEIRPINQKDANKFVVKHHRHHRQVVGSIFQISCANEEEIIGVAICGRPVGRKINYKKVIEVNRLCVSVGNPNACSMLYAACARIAKEMGYKKIITYVLESETGVSLKASGWTNEGLAGGKVWDTPSRRRMNDISDLFGSSKKYPEQKKIRWSKMLNSDKKVQGSVARDDEKSGETDNIKPSNPTNQTKEQ